MFFRVNRLIRFGRSYLRWYLAVVESIEMVQLINIVHVKCRLHYMNYIINKVYLTCAQINTPKYACQ